MKLAWITTASKGAFDLSYLDVRRKEMNIKDFNYTEIDIECMKKYELYEILGKYEVIFVEGGNSFYLLKVVRENGFDEVIKKLLSEGLVYIGSSAGAYVVSPSIESSKWMNKSKFNMSFVSDYSGMNLVSFTMFMHYNEYSNSEKEIINKKVKESNFHVKILNDGQGIVVEGDDVTVIK